MRTPTIGSIWIDFARAQLGAHFIRVESKSNNTDGPTRDDLSWVEKLQAIYRDPVPLAWFADVKAMP